ncbi:MAG: Nitrogen permease regulator 3 [Thelocarpon impressellum]|nr:MAG: Nitrogen permease regulator 3 [Thelocarpon impressellum]
MAQVLPSNPSLVAVLLVVSTRAGPRLVFHYPPDPRDDLPPRHSTGKGAAGGSDSDDSSDLEDLSSSDEASFTSPSFGRLPKSSKRPSRKAGDDDDDSSSADSADSAGRPKAKGPAFDTLFGFPTAALESILSPSRYFNKKKFELMLEPLVYVSYPVYVREDGQWRKKSVRRRKGKRDVRSTDEDEPEISGVGTEAEGATPSPEGLAGLDADTSADEADGKHGKDDDTQAMSMFNVLFVLNPPELEYNLRVNQMYEHVAKKLAKAFKYEQARSNWVWKESERILNLKEKGREEGTPMTSLWPAIVRKSGLAKALVDVFLAIASSKIAHVFISDQRFDVSLQIPQVTSISAMPSAIEPQMPGVWLTTADVHEDDEGAEESSTRLAKHFSLLLLDDVDNILKDIEREPSPLPLASSLAKFVKLVKPTMSFREMSAAHGISLADIQVLSSHLIYWRRARAIPPLHQRDVYVVSPNADMRSLAAATEAYATRFPTLPSLPKMLAVLSGQPRPYRTFIPSKPHRPAYLEILAWLMKAGWVTQLRTFAWVRIPRSVKEAVAREAPRSPRPSGATSPTGRRADTEILLQPHKATARTAAELAYIARALLADMPELQEAWPRLLKYFTGKQPLEKIAGREGWKPKEVWRLLGALETRGVLLVTRHW